jgi:hypothetical protein
MPGIERFSEPGLAVRFDRVLTGVACADHEMQTS